MAQTPLEEKALYDGADGMVETRDTELPQSTIGMQARKKALREGRCISVRGLDPKAVAPPDAQHFDWYKGKAPRAGYVGWYENADRECVGFLAADGTVKAWTPENSAPHETPATVAGEEQGAARKVKRKAKRAKKTADADPED